MSYLRTKDDLEIDLIVERPGAKRLLVEIKSKDQVTEHEANALETLGVAIDKNAEKWLISCDPLDRRFRATRALHWQRALKELFPGK